MKKTGVFALLLLLVIMAPVFAQTGAKKTLAILYFENNSLDKREQMAPLSKGLADMLITELSKVEEFHVIERSQLQQLIQEMALGQSGMLDAGSSQQVGKLLGAQYLLLGSYMYMFDGNMRIDVRIVKVETGITVKAEEETGKPKDLSKMITLLTAKVIKNLDVRISKAEIAKLKDVDNTSFDASLYYARGLEYEDAGDTQNAIKMYEKALKANKNFSKASQKLSELKNQ